jgi:hypothetical protein
VSHPTSAALPRVRVARAAAAPSRPVVQRIAQVDVPMTPVAPQPEAEPEPAVTPSLFRRIFRRPAAPRPQSAREIVPTGPSTPSGPSAPPRATVSRVVSAAEPPRPRIDLQEAPPEPAVSETPAIRGTSPERLARMLGTDVEVDAEGNPTVSMPGAPFSTAPVSVSRAENEGSSEPAATTPSTPVTTPASAAAEVDMQAITDSVIEALRRELVIEREQAGGPMDLI